MTVSELLEGLKGVDPNTLVVLSRDEEGNGFSELADINPDYYYKDGDIGYPKLTDELRDEGYSEEDVMHGGKPAIVLWP